MTLYSNCVICLVEMHLPLMRKWKICFGKLKQTSDSIITKNNLLKQMTKLLPFAIQHFSMILIEVHIQIFLKVCTKYWYFWVHPICILLFHRFYLLEISSHLIFFEVTNQMLTLLDNIESLALNIIWFIFDTL